MKFQYQAFDRAGAAALGVIDARDITDAKELLRRQGIFATKVAETSDTQSVHAPSAKPSFSQGRRLNNIAMFTRQLYVLLSTGTPLVEALRALERQTKDLRWKQIVTSLRSKVEEGASLSAAMAQHPDQFDAVCLGLVAAGEAGGSLDAMLDRLAVLTRKQVHVRSAIVGAMIYPSLLVVVSFGVLITLMTFVLPRFTVLFQTLDTPLPPTTKFLMSISDLLTGYWWLLAPGLIGGGFGLFHWIGTEHGRDTITQVALNLPRLGAILRNFAAARITRLLGILLQGQVPLIESLRLTQDSLRMKPYVQLLARATEMVTRGEPLAGVFADTDLLQPSVYEAMRSGEKSGQLGPLLKTVADFLDEENDVTLRSLTSILEPLILIVLGVVVGFIAMSMFMPLFDLTAAARGGN